MNEKKTVSAPKPIPKAKTGTAPKQATATKTPAVHSAPQATKPSKPAAYRRMKKSPQAIALSNQIKDKSKPVFRGRFGKKHSRKVKSAKWDKWRVPRGIDVVKNQESGAFPRPGYRTPKSLRFLHPSGYPEIVVYTEKELEGKKDVAVRIAGTVGKRKRKAIVEKALALNLMVLNR